MSISLTSQGFAFDIPQPDLQVYLLQPAGECRGRGKEDEVCRFRQNQLGAFQDRLS